MNARRYLQTKELAQAVGVSVQQVRNYEAAGFLPAVERSASGYRRYTRQHLAALKAARLLIPAYGSQRARQIMQAAHAGRLDEALALINERHAELDWTRLQLEQTLETLSVLAGQPPSPAEAGAPSHPRFGQRLRVGAAARMAGVQVSALRFWEQQGLLQPVREPGNRYRLYDERQLRRLRVVVLLRQASHDFEAIRATLDELESGQPQRALAAVEQRRQELAAASWRCLGAMAAFYAYASEFLKK